MTACEDIRMLLGAHALGTLDSADEQRVRQHLETCDSCSSEAAELAETAAALALVDAGDVLEPAEPPGGLESLLARVRAHRRRRRLATLAVAASVAVAAGVGGLVAGSGSSREVPESETPSVAESVPPDASVSAEEASVALAVDAWDKGWGTALRAEVSGVPSGSRCTLVAVGQDGTREIAASWVVPGNGYNESSGLTVDGAVGLRRADVDHYEVVKADGADGTTLVTVPASPS